MEKCRIILTGDHPRGCGEHSPKLPNFPMNEGSSPRMRGAPVQRCPRGGKGRIIPADAGSTSLYSVTYCCFWDHPRGCGEHVMR